MKTLLLAFTADGPEEQEHHEDRDHDDRDLRERVVHDLDHGLAALGIALLLIGNLLAIDQAAQAGALDSGDVDENAVIATLTTRFN